MRNGAPFSKPRVRLYGETGDAQNYLGAAYNLLYKVRQYCENTGVPVFAMQHSLPDGAVVHAAIIGNEEIVSCFPPAYTRPAEVIPTGKPREKRVFGGFLYSPAGGSTNGPLGAWAFPGGKITLTEPERVDWETVFHRIVTYKRYDPELKKDLFMGLNPDEQKEPEFEFDTKLQAGPVSWRGFREDEKGNKEEVIVSYDHGLPCRYRLTPDLDCSGRLLGMERGVPYFAQNGARNLYVWGELVETNHNVVGAGMFKNTLMYVAHVETKWGEGGVPDDPIKRAEKNSTCATFFALVGKNWVDVGNVRYGSSLRSPWFFSPDGSKVTSVTDYGDTYAIFEVSLHMDERSKKITLSYSVKEELLEARTYVFPSLPEEKMTYHTGKGPCGDKAEWTYGSWMMWHPGDTPYAGEFGPLTIQKTIDYQQQLYAYLVEEALAQYSTIGELRMLDDGIENQNAYIANCFANTDNGFEGGCSEPWRPSGTQVSSWLVLNFWGNNTGWVRILADRSHRVVSDHYSREWVYEARIEGERIFGTDYDFEGNLVVGRQKMDDGDSLYRNTFANRHINEREPSGTGPSIRSCREYSTKREWEIKMSWSLTANGTTLVSARAGAGLQANSESFAKARYQRELLRWEEYEARTGVYSSSSFDFQVIESGTDFATEKVWLFDVDLRTNSAVYNKAIVEAEVVPIDVSIGYVDVQFTDSILKTTSKRSDYAVVVHNGNKVLVKEVPAGSSGGIQPMHEQGALHVLVPRMFTQDEKLQDNIPHAVVVGAGYDAVVHNWRWGVHPAAGDCWPNRRSAGMLCVRDPDNCVITVHDSSVVGQYGQPCWRTPRAHNFFTYALINGITDDFIASMLSAANRHNAKEETEEELEKLPPPVRLIPVRAI